MKTKDVLSNFSYIGLATIFFGPVVANGDYELLYWLFVTVIIGISAIAALFSPTPISNKQRAGFVFVFIALLPLFTSTWSERLERGGDGGISGIIPGFGIPEWVEPVDKEKMELRAEYAKKIDKLERDKGELQQQNSALRQKRYESHVFWQGILHLFGMGFALLACTCTIPTARMVAQSPDNSASS